jgi:histone H3/H4
MATEASTPLPLIKKKHRKSGPVAARIWSRRVKAAQRSGDHVLSDAPFKRLAVHSLKQFRSLDGKSSGETMKLRKTALALLHSTAEIWMVRQLSRAGAILYRKIGSTTLEASHLALLDEVLREK